MSAEVQVYQPVNNVRVVTATSLFDGHDASINIFRRILQSTGAEVIHLGHNRSWPGFSKQISLGVEHLLPGQMCVSRSIVTMVVKMRQWIFSISQHWHRPILPSPPGKECATCQAGAKQPCPETFLSKITIQLVVDGDPCL